MVQSGKLGQSLGTLPRSGRPKILSRVSINLIIYVHVYLCLSGTNLTMVVTQMESPCTLYSAVREIHRNWCSQNCDGLSRKLLYLYYRVYQKCCRITNKMMQNRLDFALKHKNWTVTDWEKVLWADESLFQLFAPQNRQNDRVWSRSSADVQPFKCVKFPAKIQVWRMMSTI